VRVEPGVPSNLVVKFVNSAGLRGRRPPIRKPNPLAADDVYERVSHGAETSAQIAGERLSAERGRRLQDPVVCPAVAFLEKLNVLSGHVGSGNPFVCRILAWSGDSGRASLNISESNRRIAEQFNDAFNRGDLDGAANCFSEECQNHGKKVGRAGVRAVLGEIKINFPDAKLTTLNSVVEGEWVVARCTYSGTHRGSSCFPVDGGMLVGVQPTGRTFAVQHIHMYRVRDGKIAEHFASRDDVGMMRQLGLLPPPPSLSGQ